MINCVQESGAPKLHNFCTLLYMEVILMSIKYYIDSHGNMILNSHDRENFVRAFEEAREKDPSVQLGLNEEKSELFFAKR